MIRELEEKIKRLEEQEKDSEILRIKRKEITEKYEKKFKPYDRVQLARHRERPKVKDFIENIIEEPMFFHGDRLFSDDKSIIGGIGYLDDIPITFVGTNKGNTLEENVQCNFGMPKPEGYRKALRLMKQAEKFNRPIITFIDTPGAYPGVDAEERGQGEAIARNISEMGRLKVPIISVFTGEGGSGGALALSVANKIIMMENSIFSILSPEGFATILWKDGTRCKEATEVMKLMAKELYDYNIVDRVVEEDISFSLEGFRDNFIRLKKVIIEELQMLMIKNSKELIIERQEKYRRIGGGF
ncbi:MAG: acetyl-CoA carboxylase carboxyltransferase subunit alpha [Tissierellia bacterium]|nr:acetyl-CoA carboxylase carboxyltransferase subunit alpha [Tissierellia bacterium]